MELALLFFLSALAVTLIDWIGSDALASLVRPPSPSSPSPDLPHPHTGS